MISRFPRKFSVGPELSEVEGCVVGKHEWTPAWLYAPGFVRNFGMYPSSVILEEFWLETVRVMCLCHQMEVWSGDNERHVARSIRWVRDGVMCEGGCVLGLADRRVLRGAETKVAGSS